MDKRVNELRDRLWKKKAALQQKENLPVSGLLGCGREEGREASPGRSVLGSGFVVSAGCALRREAALRAAQT